MRKTHYNQKAVYTAMTTIFLFVVMIQLAQGDEIIFRDTFFGNAVHEAWNYNQFSVAADASAPDGDGYVLQRTNPDSYKSAGYDDFFQIVPGYDFKLTAVVKIASVSGAGNGASTSVGFRKNSNNDQYSLFINAHAPNLINLAMVSGGTASIIYTFDVSSASPALSLAQGDWIEASLSINDGAQLKISIKKWLGSSWSAAAETTYSDSSNLRNEKWGVMLSCWEYPTDINTTHNVDGVSLTMIEQVSKNFEHLIWQDRFTSDTLTKVWYTTRYQKTIDSSTPDGDNSIFLHNNIGGGALSDDTFNIPTDKKIRIKGMFKLSPAAPADGNNTRLCFRHEDTSLYFVQCNGGSLSQYFHFGRIDGFLYTFYNTQNRYPFINTSPGDWVELRMDIDSSSAIIVGVKKWLGSAWSEEGVFTVMDSNLSRTESWRILIDEIRYTAALDNLRVYVVSSSSTPETPLPTPVPPLPTPKVLTSGRMATYLPPAQPSKYFGPYVIKMPDRYVMFFSANGTIKDGKPSHISPGDPGTYNNVCSTWAADRIWITWHLGDGKTPSGWDAPDGVHPNPPILALNIGDHPDEIDKGLIGDQSVFYWKGQWHMYYTAANCGGGENIICHATAADWAGPWTKQGKINGLPIGRLPTNPIGIGGANVYLDGDELYFYYVDGGHNFPCARATNDTGQNFELYSLMYLGWGTSGENRVTQEPNGSYRLLFDTEMQTQIYQGFSTNRFYFPYQHFLFGTQNNTPQWENKITSQGFYMKVGDEHRYYYQGEGTEVLGGIGIFYWTEEDPPPTPTPTPTPSPTPIESRIENWSIFK